MPAPPDGRTRLSTVAHPLEIAALKIGDLHQNRGCDSLRAMRKGGRRDAFAINPQTAARLRATFITTALENGVQLEGVQKAVGRVTRARPSCMIGGATTRRRRSFFATC